MGRLDELGESTAFAVASSAARCLSPHCQPARRNVSAAGRAAQLAIEDKLVAGVGVMSKTRAPMSASGSARAGKRGRVEDVTRQELDGQMPVIREGSGAIRGSGAQAVTRHPRARSARDSASFCDVSWHRYDATSLTVTREPRRTRYGEHEGSGTSWQSCHHQPGPPTRIMMGFAMCKRPRTRTVEIALLGERLAPLRLCDAAAVTSICQSLERHGQLSALVLFMLCDQLEIIDGFKRVRAARALGWNREGHQARLSPSRKVALETEPDEPQSNAPYTNKRAWTPRLAPSRH
jgi:hypothetical protein